jgi:hypothetical protein
VESEVEKLAQTKKYLVDPVTKLHGESHYSLKKAAVSKYELKRGLWWIYNHPAGKPSL